MELNQDDKILLALYAEWLKDIPEFRSVNAVSMGMSDDVFNWGFAKLATMGMVSGVDWNMKETGISVSRNCAVLTKDGVERAEKLLGAERSSVKISWHKISVALAENGSMVMARRVGEIVGLG